LYNDLQRVAVGGYPEVIDLTPRQRERWFAAYAETVIARNVAEVAEVRDGEGLPALVGIAAARTERTGGALPEDLVVGELAREYGWSETRARLYHLREHRGAEVYIAAEAPDGRVVALEVQATQSRPAAGRENLVALRDRLALTPDRFVHGFGLYTGEQAYSLGAKLLAIPLDALWTAMPSSPVPTSPMASVGCAALAERSTCSSRSRASGAASVPRVGAGGWRNSRASSWTPCFTSCRRVDGCCERCIALGPRLLAPARPLPSA
jgi:predicted AAA+ superfamily ATPase